MTHHETEAPEHTFRLTGPIVLDPYFALENHLAASGRIVDLAIAPSGIRVTLFSAGAPIQKYVLLAVDPSDLSQLKRGDHVAFTAIADSITKFAIVSRADTELPLVADWADDERREERLRFREVDVLLRPGAWRMIATRSAVLFGIRQYLQQRGFVEVELPVLKRRPDIAPAQHFEVTNNNGGKLYLRTTFPPFERLLVSLDRAYTMGPNFRNGDWSHKNIPEFTMLCLMMRGASYLDAHRLVRAMIAEVVASVTGSTSVQFRGSTIDLASWQEISLDDVLSERYNLKLEDLDNDDAMAAFASQHGVGLPEQLAGGHMFRAALFDRLFETLIVPSFPHPTFFTDVPWYLAGPAERHPTKAGVKLRGEGYVAGMELTNAKNVLTDLAALRIWHQSVAAEKRRAGFADEYAAVDDDYLRSVGYGLQPGALSSLGVDRLIMLALGVDEITESVMYPLP
jgi:lysyl-tRNA synthetase class 2